MGAELINFKGSGCKFIFSKLHLVLIAYCHCCPLSISDIGFSFQMIKLPNACSIAWKCSNSLLNSRKSAFSSRVLIFRFAKSDTQISIAEVAKFPKKTAASISSTYFLLFLNISQIWRLEFSLQSKKKRLQRRRRKGSTRISIFHSSNTYPSKLSHSALFWIVMAFRRLRQLE